MSKVYTSKAFKLGHSIVMTIPKEICQKLGIDNNTALILIPEEEKIIVVKAELLKKYVEKEE